MKLFFLFDRHVWNIVASNRRHGCLMTHPYTLTLFNSLFSNSTYINGLGYFGEIVRYVSARAIFGHNGLH